MEQISLTIDGNIVKGTEGQTILEIALNNGIDIPHLCYHPRLSKSGACRLCLVRINKKMLKASCYEPAIDGMDVITEDEEISAHRKWILGLLLSEGDHNCLYWDANGDCELQTYIKRYDVQPEKDMEFIKRERVIDYSSSHIFKRNENRCILCYRCVRACKEVQASNVWSLIERGFSARLVTGADKPWGK